MRRMLKNNSMLFLIKKFKNNIIMYMYRYAALKGIDFTLPPVIMLIVWEKTYTIHIPKAYGTTGL